MTMIMIDVFPLLPPPPSSYPQPQSTSYTKPTLSNHNQHKNNPDSFNYNMAAYLIALGATYMPPADSPNPYQPTGIYNIITTWKNRQVIIINVILDADTFENIWNYMGSTIGTRSLVQVYNNSRLDRTYEFTHVKSESERNYPAHCTNQVFDNDGTETDLNCGGHCLPCLGDNACLVKSDCLSDKCLATGLCYDALNGVGDQQQQSLIILTFALIATIIALGG